jgi:cbb3-type cytochrome oxidase subunit 3
MTYFIFVGDMLVMLFMVILAIWVFAFTPKEKIEEAAQIPLEDES